MAVAKTYGGSIVARRWLGAWIDFAVLLSFLAIPDYLLGNQTYRATLFVWVGLFVAYFPVMETLLGRSAGKFATRTRVVNAHGQNPSLVQSVVRTLFRLIEVNPILAGGAPAGIAARASQHKQRLGDMAARTYVLLERDARRVGALELPNDSLEPTPLHGTA
jgi:uncharacterized RDD family membrane protein YckC